MLGPLSQTNTVPMLGLLHRVRAPGKVKVGACALSARTFITSEHGSDADDDDIIYLFRMAQLNTVHIKIYTRFLFSEVLIHTIVQSCNIRKYKINIKNIKNVKYMT